MVSESYSLTKDVLLQRQTVLFLFALLLGAAQKSMSQ